VVLLSDRSEPEGREIAEFSGAADHVETLAGAEGLVWTVRRVLRAAELPRAASRLTRQNAFFHPLNP